MNNFVPINILLAPRICKDVQYDTDAIKQSCFYKLFMETTVTYNTWEKMYKLTHNMQGKWKHNGVQYYVVGTINYAMGDTLPSVAT